MILMHKNLAAAAMAHSASELPQDLINKVLVRLPAKSVGRFRCVSKAWLSHLSSLEFMKTHRNFHIHRAVRNIIVPVSTHSRARNLMVPAPHDHTSDQFPYLVTFAADGSDSSSRKVSSPLFTTGRGWIRLGAVCHGFAVVMLKGSDRSVLVLNPLTLEALKVPRPPYPLSKNFGERVCQLGMGYDSSSDDYKIVLFSYHIGHFGREYDGTYVDVFSLKTKSWKSLANSPFDHHDEPDPCPVAFTNGHLHWMAEDSKGCVIAAFNLAREEFERVPPPTDDFAESGGELTVLGGCLAVEWPCRIFNESITMWIMKEYGVKGSWNKLVIDTPSKSLIGCVCPTKEDEIVFKKFYNENPEQFVLYNLSTGLWREFFVDGVPENFGTPEMLNTFTECLLSPRYISD